MTPDTTVVSEPVTDHAEVMASVDTNGRTRRLIIADVSCDDAWIAAPIGDAVTISEWR